jgi:nucleoside-diphosphate-sugar epimerase
MKYFLTGATGFVGGYVAKQLIAAGHEVVAVVRNPDKAQELKNLGVKLFKGDVTDKESMRVPMQGVDGVFHIAGWYKIGVKDKSEGVKINVDGSRNVFELMKELKIPKGVYTSTLAVNSDTHGKLVDESYLFNGKHMSEYDRTKWAAHYEVAMPMITTGLPLVIVMPGLIYGIGDTSSARTTFIQYLTRKLPIMPTKTAYSWAHVEDIAAAHIAAMEKGKPGQDYIIAGPTHTFVEAMQIAEKITGVPAPKMKAPPFMLKTMSGFMSVVGKIIPLPDQYSAEYLRVSAGVTYIGDNSKARRDLGYNPRSLEVGLRETLEYEMQLLGMKPNKK